MEYFVRIKDSDTHTLNEFCKRNCAKIMFLENGWMGQHKNTSLYSLKMRVSDELSFKLSFSITLLKKRP